jgi:hydroxymethylpyrimidine/phosphomethylpyrimidine kinase
VADEVPVCLTIGSSDSSGGAGIQGDIKAFASVGCYAATVLVGVTAQSLAGVVGRHTVPPDHVESQLRVVQDELSIAGVKVGTTWSRELLACLGPHLDELQSRGVPLVIDPVMVTASGSWLTDHAGIRKAVADHLLPAATVVTPNRAEAEFLAGSGSEAAERRELAEEIVGLGASAVVITAGPKESGDWFFDGEEHHHVDGPRYDNGAEHGVGCAHSALLSGLLAQGWLLRDAIHEAHRRAATGVRRGLTGLGREVHPVDVLGLPERRSESGGSPGGADSTVQPTGEVCS